MRKSLATCIYCDEVVDISKGTGDHIIPETFGEFEGDKHFHRICKRCHGIVDKSIDELSRCGLEAVARRRLGIASKRSRRKDHRKQIGATGARPPEHTVLMDAHFAAVRATDSPDDVEAIDYLAATDEEGGERRIQLFPKLRPEQLKERLERANVRSIVGAHMQCSDKTWPNYCKLLQAVQPGMKMTELPCTEPGVHRRLGRVFCTITERYFQAIAKIAFHYYLIHSKRNLKGHEAIFQGIRNFILSGGDKDRIVASYQQSPATPLPTSLNRSAWSHVLAANESESTLTVRLQLFSGPDSPTLIHHVTLGELGDCVVVPKFVWGHKYRYYARKKASGRFIGIVERLPIVGLPENFWVPPKSVAL